MLLAGKQYDPATEANVATTAATAMTAFDTTNLRLTFTAPSSGRVLVRIGCTGTVATGPLMPQVLLGVLASSTVVARVAANPIIGSSNVGAYGRYEVQFVVSGLTPGDSYTWDAAYGVETGQASTKLAWGGPDDTTGNNAFGGFTFEVWDANDCLAGILYDPATAASVGGSAQTVMAAVDTTNLRATFTAPSNGKVLCRVRAVQHGGGGNTNFLLGVLDGSTIRGRQSAAGHGNTWDAATLIGEEAVFLVTGLTADQSYTFDAAWGIDGYISPTPGAMKWGGPNDTTANNAFGAFQFEIWKTVMP